MTILKEHWSVPYIIYAQRLQFRESELISISETDEDRQLTSGELRHKYKIIAKERFDRKMFLNKNTKWQILVNRTGLNKWTYREIPDREKTILIQVLNKIIEDAILIRTEPDNKNRPNYESSSVFTYELIINNRRRKVLMRTVKFVNKLNRFKYLGWDDIVLIK
jgi:hypothetical protein